MAQTLDAHTEFVRHPQGAIPKGSFCQVCKRFNARHVTCTTIVVNRKQECLLVLRQQDPQKDFWALPGGYLDWDETVAECAA